MEFADGDFVSEVSKVYVLRHRDERFERMVFGDGFVCLRLKDEEVVWCAVEGEAEFFDVSDGKGFNRFRQEPTGGVFCETEFHKMGVWFFDASLREERVNVKFQHIEIPYSFN